MDDTVTLEAVARVLELDASMPPTTAIKSLGITDPSTVRRLREKLRAAGRRAPQVQAIRKGPVTVKPQPADREVMLACEAGPEAQFELPTTASSDLASGASAWMIAWCGVGLHALTSVLEVQRAGVESLIRSPAMATALKSQLMLNEYLLAVSRRETESRVTLH